MMPGGMEEIQESEESEESGVTMSVTLSDYQGKPISMIIVRAEAILRLPTYSNLKIRF